MNVTHIFTIMSAVLLAAAPMTAPAAPKPGSKAAQKEAAKKRKDQEAKQQQQRAEIERKRAAALAAAKTAREGTLEEWVKATGMWGCTLPKEGDTVLLDRPVTVFLTSGECNTFIDLLYADHEAATRYVAASVQGGRAHEFPAGTVLVVKMNNALSRAEQYLNQHPGEGVHDWQLAAYAAVLVDGTDSERGWCANTWLEKNKHVSPAAEPSPAPAEKKPKKKKQPRG